MISTLIVIALGLSQAPGSADAPPQQDSIPASANITQPASPSKLRLIREFLKLTGWQKELDTGSFLERHAAPGGAMWKLTEGQVIVGNLSDQFNSRWEVLYKIYLPHRDEYQKA